MIQFSNICLVYSLTSVRLSEFYKICSVIMTQYLHKAQHLLNSVMTSLWHLFKNGRVSFVIYLKNGKVYYEFVFRQFHYCISRILFLVTRFAFYSSMFITTKHLVFLRIFCFSAFFYINHAKICNIDIFLLAIPPQINFLRLSQ